MSTAAPEAGRKDSKQPRQAVSEQQVHELFDSITGTGEDSHNVITPEDFKVGPAAACGLQWPRHVTCCRAGCPGRVWAACHGRVYQRALQAV